MTNGIWRDATGLCRRYAAPSWVVGRSWVPWVPLRFTHGYCCVSPDGLEMKWVTKGAASAVMNEPKNDR